MKLTILGSSSHGNCYILHNDTEALIIELGVAMKDVKQALKGKISKIAAAIVSHEHKDHAGHVQDALECAIPVYMSQGTIDATQLTGFKKATAIKAMQSFSVGGFTILPFDTQHDCNEPLGFLISHAETGNILFATDTYYLKYKFAGLNNIMLEANYCEDILNHNIAEGKIPVVVKNRTLQSHMSIETCKQALQANNLTQVNTILLLHLSDGNSDEKRFKKEVEQLTGKTVIVADKGMTIDFNKTPFLK